MQIAVPVSSFVLECLKNGQTPSEKEEICDQSDHPIGNRSFPAQSCSATAVNHLTVCQILRLFKENFCSLRRQGYFDDGLQTSSPDSSARLVPNVRSARNMLSKEKHLPISDYTVRRELTTRGWNDCLTACHR